MSLVGNLADLGLGEILQIVSLSRKSGVLTLQSRGRQGIVVFRFGQVVRATSSSIRYFLGEDLLKRKVVDEECLNKALQVQQGSAYKEKLGPILINRFNIPVEKIEEVVREQIERVVYSFFSDGMLSTRSRSRGRTFTCSPGFWYFVSRRRRCVSAIAAMIATSRMTAAISNGYTYSV